MESKSFPSNFDIAGGYAKHRKLHYLRFSEQGKFRIKKQPGLIKKTKAYRQFDKPLFMPVFTNT